MGLFDIFKKKKETPINLRDLIIDDYELQYPEECLFIRETYVPESGQSEVLQGELMRQLDALRIEAKEYGNIHWDTDFSWFCEFIKRTLCNMSIYSEEEMTKITLIMDYMKYCGEYAGNLGGGEDVNTNSIAYTKDNLYDMIADAIGKLQNVHPDPIPCEINYGIQR